MNVKRRTQAERSGATRSTLVAAGRSLFSERGYAGTGTEDIVERAGLTRGALYHHFGDKRELFMAVFEQLEEELVRKVAARASGASDAWQQLVAGSEAFLDACLEPAVQRIVLLDAPSVLGWATWREVDARCGLGLTKSALRAVMDAGVVAPQPVEPLAHMLLAALNEGALYMASAEDRDRAREEVGATVSRLLEGLRAG
ncbi:MAG: TetR/AcrR family transcriptional regulator [Actinomycetota bacterium]